MPVSNSPSSIPANHQRNTEVASAMKCVVVILSLIYLACIPLGKLGEKRFTPVDLGLLMVVLIVNSDVKLKDTIERLASAKVTPTSVEFTLKERVEQLSEKIDDQAKNQAAQDKADAEAKSWVDLQLSETAYGKVNVSELRKKIHSAASSATETIYKMAKDARRNGYDKKGIIERTIPIFQALIDSGYENERYRFYAQAGYALKDQENPDWEAAESSLNMAVLLWEEKHSTGYPPSLYCFNWLFCAAQLNDKPELEQEELDKRIEAATMCKTLYSVIRKEENKSILDWMCKNYGGDISTLTPKFSSLNGYCRKDPDEQKRLLSRV